VTVSGLSLLLWSSRTSGGRGVSRGLHYQSLEYLITTLILLEKVRSKEADITDDIIIL
jgi:hypothetical protein